MRPEILRFFTSHRFGYDSDRQTVHKHLEHAWPKGRVYEVLEPSLSHHDGTLSHKKIQDRLRKLIVRADVVIVIAARYANGAEWMEFEVKTAKRLNKPIILMMRPDRKLRPRKLIELSGVQPTESYRLRSKIRELLPASRLKDLDELELRLIREDGEARRTRARPVTRQPLNGQINSIPVA